MSRFLTALIAGTALMGAATAAQAAPYTISSTPGQIIQTYAPGGISTDFQVSNAFALFDSSVGTLTSITFSATYGLGSTVTVTNAETANSNAIGTVNRRSQLLVSSDSEAPNTVLVSKFATQEDPSISPAGATQYTIDVLGATKSIGTLTPGSSVTVTSDSPTISPIDSFTTGASSDLNAFQALGGGFFNLYLTSYSVTNTSITGGQASTTNITTGTPTFSLEYDYVTASTDVPEPASMAILGAGLLSAGLLRRRSRK